MKKTTLHLTSSTGKVQPGRQWAPTTRKIAVLALLGAAAAFVVLTVQAQPAQSSGTDAVDAVPLPQNHTLVGNPAIYQGFEPCRMVDTRTTNGIYGGPKLVAGSTRTFDLDVGGFAGLCGNSFPPGVTAMVVNVTLVNQDGPGFATIYPGNATQPVASSINSSGPNTVVGNEIVMPLAPDGSVKVFTSVGTHLVMDLVGIFTNNLDGGDNFFVTGNIGTGTGNGMLEAYNSSSVQNSVAVRGVMSSTTAGAFSTGVRGISEGTASTGIGVWGTQNGSGYGVYGNVSGAGRGVFGETTTGVGVYGLATGGGLAGFFSGNVSVAGTLSKSAGSFKIDHPQDPANKYLSHSFVESPEMKNIYDGNATTGKDGRAVVTMPEYFTALNQDFRYQLTVIGEDFAQALVAREITENTFVIKTDKPNVKVSWQVTGVRHDAYADAHRIAVEEEKTGVERGAYLHPELFGEPKEKGIEYARRHETLSEEQASRTAASAPEHAGGSSGGR